MLLTAAALLMSPGVATAHSSLVSSSPAEGESLTAAPAEVELVFDQVINSSFLTVAISDQSGRRFDDGAPTADGERVRTGIEGTLPPGSYTAAYRVISADGHPITGSYSFTVTGTAATAAPATPAPAPSAAAEQPEPADTGGPSAALLGTIVVFGILGVAGSTWILLRSRKKS